MSQDISTNVLPSDFEHKLDAVQARILSLGLLDRGALLNTPTGSGKTFLSKIATARALDRGGRVVFVCPLRSLAKEVAKDWGEDVSFEGVTVGLFTGEVGMDDGSELISPRDARIIVMTAEKLDGFLRAWWRHLDWLAEIELLITDELHTLGDGRRGATLDGVITRFKAINPYSKHLSLSATLGNVPELANWLGVEYFVSRKRVVPMKWRVATYRAGKGGMTARAKVVEGEVEATSEAGGQTLVFVQSRARAEQLAKSLQEAGLNVAFHHAGMSAEQREEIERQFRAHELEGIVATPTLAMGVNLPARKCIIHDLERFENGQAVRLSSNEVWQLGGRAGRRGKDAEGEVVLLAAQHEQGSAWQYAKGNFEPIISPLAEPSMLAGQVIAMIGGRYAEDEAQLRRVMKSTLAAHQCRGFDQMVNSALKDMIEAKMVECSKHGLRTTKIGYAAVRHMVTPKTVHAWATALKTGGDSLAFLDLLTLAASVPESGARIRLKRDDIAFVAQKSRVNALWLRGLPAEQWVSMTGQDEPLEVAGGFAAAVALQVWSQTGDADKASQWIGLGKSEFEDIKREGLRMLLALRDVSQALQFGGSKGVINLGAPPSVSERIRAAAAMVACGLEARAATMALIEGIGPVFGRKLVEAGVADLDALAKADSTTLEDINGVSKKRAKAWVQQARGMKAMGGAFRYAEAGLWAAWNTSGLDGQDDALTLQDLWDLSRRR